MKYLILSIMFLFFNNLQSEIVVFRNGKEKQIKINKIENKKIYLNNGDIIKLDDVSMIRLTSKKQKLVKNEINDPQLVKRADKLFKKAEEMRKKYPDSQAIIVDDYGKEKYNKDGTTESEYYYAVMILKENAKREYNRVITYETKGRSTSEIVYANVYCSGDKIYKFDPSKVMTAAPQSAQKFFDAGGRYKIYPLEGLDTGCILEYKIKNNYYNPYKKEFYFPRWSFQTTNPVVRSRIEITLPRNIDLNYKTINFKGKFKKFAKPKIIKNKKTKTYIWNVKNIPPLIPEPQMPPLGDVAMRLYGSVLKNWDMIFDWTNKLYRERTQPGKELREFTLNLIKGLKTDEEKAAKIYHYVQKDIRYIAVKVGIGSGIGGYDANLTWKRKWGCCVDKALLLSAMMSVAGIKNSPILIATNNTPKFPVEVPAFYFDHAISVIYLNGKKIFLDSTNYDYRFPEIAAFDYGVNVLNIFNRTIDYIPLPKPNENAGFYAYDITLNKKGGIHVKNHMTYAGTKEAEVRGYYRSIKEEERKNTFENIVKNVSPNAKLLNYSITDPNNLEIPYEMHIEYKAENYIQKAKDIAIFKLPDFKLPSWELYDISLDKRKYPIEKMVNTSKYYTYNIKIPDSMEIISLPENKEIKSKHLDFSAGCSKENNMIICRKNLERKTRIIPPEDYQEYKNILQEINKYCQQNIYLKIK